MLLVVRACCVLIPCGLKAAEFCQPCLVEGTDARQCKRTRSGGGPILCFTRYTVYLVGLWLSVPQVSCLLRFVSSYSGEASMKNALMREGFENAPHPRRIVRLTKNIWNFAGPITSYHMGCIWTASEYIGTAANKLPWNKQVWLHFPGHALREMGFREQRSVGTLVSSQEQRAAVVLLTNRLSAAGQTLVFVLPSVYVIYPLFVLPTMVQDSFFDPSAGKRNDCRLGETNCRPPVLPCHAVPRRSAVRRPDLPMVCPGAGVDRC